MNYYCKDLILLGGKKCYHSSELLLVDADTEIRTGEARDISYAAFVVACCGTHF
jgi:hypothetical protein